MQPFEIIMTVFFVLAIIVFIINIRHQHRDIFIKLVSAGPEHIEEKIKDEIVGQLSKDCYSYYKSQNINPRDYLFMKVEGKCMEPKKINDQDIVLIEKFPFFQSSKQKSKKIKKGNVLLIDFVDKKKSRRIIKIREFVSLDEHGAAITQHYDESGAAKQSRHRHELKNIRGIVRYADGIIL